METSSSMIEIGKRACVLLARSSLEVWQGGRMIGGLGEHGGTEGGGYRHYLLGGWCFAHQPPR